LLSFAIENMVISNWYIYIIIYWYIDWSPMYFAAWKPPNLCRELPTTRLAQLVQSRIQAESWKIRWDV
jgi:hypothetical protein